MSDFLFTRNAYTEQNPYSNRLQASGFDDSNSMHALSSAWDEQGTLVRNSQSANYNESGYNNSTAGRDRDRGRGEGNGRGAASSRGGRQERYQRVERGQYVPFERKTYNHIRIGLDQHPLSSIFLRETITDSSKIDQPEINSPRLDDSPGEDQMYSEQPIRNRHSESFLASPMKANSSVDTRNCSENLKSSHTYGICFFNPNHIISYDQLESHTTTCPDARWFNDFYIGWNSDA